MISFMSWNCQGIKANVHWLNTIMNNIDVIALQETWLFEHEDRFLMFNDNYKCISCSAMPNDRKLTGRPYGGLAFIIKKELMCKVKIVKRDSRLLAISIEADQKNILVVNTYFPVNSRQNEQLISMYFGKLSALLIDHCENSVILGDFNISPTHGNYNELVQFCDDNSCILLDINQLPETTKTFTSKGTGHSSWLDHIIISNGISSNDNIVWIPYATSPSDHIPICSKIDSIVVTNVNCPVQNFTQTKQSCLNWKNAPKWVAERFCNETFTILEELANFKLCSEQKCKSISHAKDIDLVYSKLTTGLQVCESKVNKLIRKGTAYSKPGWNKYVKLSYDEYRECYKKWSDNRLRSGELFEMMNLKRKQFKRTLKSVQRNKQNILNEKLAYSYEGKNFIKFWKNVKSMNSKQEVVTEKIGHALGEAEICSMWKGHYMSQFSKSDKATVRCCDTNNCANKTNAVFRVTPEKVQESISKLKLGKAPGPDCISAESLKFSHGIITVVLCNLFNSCLAHGYMPDGIMEVVLAPILKKKTLDPTIIKHYRPIALATAISKVFELLILQKYEKNLFTQPGQFGYKKGVGTETAIFTLRQIAHHYLRKGTPVYVCYLDATAAFDNVSHRLLLYKLCNRGLCNETIQLLEYWFNNQMFICRWKGTNSTPFPVRVGVRQGSINSPWYFAVYTDEMYVALQESGVGCRAGPRICNFLAYADDTVLMANTITALQKLISICEDYGQKLMITFNPQKSYLQGFVPRHMTEDKPEVRMCGSVIPWSNTVKYLGYEISCYDRDVKELLKRKRELYMQANLVASKFRSCNISIRKYIFSTFFNNIYCSSLWNPVSTKLLNPIKVAYNDSFRILFGYKRRCSASQMFMENGISDFTGMRRHVVMSLLTRLGKTTNPILKSIFNSRIFLDSSLYQTWRELLLKSDCGENDDDKYALYDIIRNVTQNILENETFTLGDEPSASFSTDEECRLGQARISPSNSNTYCT